MQNQNKCVIIAKQLRPVSQAVKTSPSHGEGSGSIPLRVTKTKTATQSGGCFCFLDPLIEPRGKAAAVRIKVKQRFTVNLRSRIKHYVSSKYIENEIPHYTTQSGGCFCFPDPLIKPRGQAGACWQTVLPHGAELFVRKNLFYISGTIYSLSLSACSILSSISFDSARTV